MTFNVHDALSTVFSERCAILCTCNCLLFLLSTDKKTANIVSLQVDDSDDEMIDADDSDQDDDEDRMDLDFNHSPPTVTQQDSYQLSPPTHLGNFLARFSFTFPHQHFRNASER
ncbi:hypothetical protein DPMN_036782 [Dreissena polymorpha]|uniref:Uncharacterized protein n=1 Tax=Dreissena polymorpha TaxID=45954 RepID=A0A9D4MC75_DREPO|nr:hypothetical protein DPMN_036782 [Dreissena polymorpha]